MNTLSVDISAHHDFTNHIPKEIEVRDSDLKLVTSQWTEPLNSCRFKLDDGVYAVRVNLSSGLNVEKIVSLSGGNEKTINLDLSVISPHETHEWAYASQTMNAPSDESLNGSTYSGAWLRLWEKTDTGWQVKPINIDKLQTQWDSDGVCYYLTLPRNLHALQIGGPELTWRFVTLPPHKKLLCLIRPVKSSAPDVHPLEVVVSTQNWTAESLLSLIYNGTIEQAKSMVGNVVDAEELLYNKKQDPVSAAVGGYYLLRVGAMQQFHDWAANLANWMDWMADGPVIRAWQLIKEAKGSTIDRSELRKWFLEAVDREFPIYTEGMRLLHEGLKLLHYNDQGDEEVNRALKRIESYVAALDWGTNTTTFNGIHPAEPNAKSRKGYPDPTELAYIFHIPPDELVKENAININDEIAVSVNNVSSFKLTVEENNKFRTSSGEEFFSIRDAAQSYTSDQTLESLSIQNISTSSYLVNKVDELRLGKRSDDV